MGTDYQRMEVEGSLHVMGNRTVPLGDFLRLLVRTWGTPDLMIADKYRDTELLDAEEAADFSIPIEFRRTGHYSANLDIRALRRAVMEEAVIPEASLLARAALREATVRSSGESLKLSKKVEAGRRASARDDYAAALILGVSGGLRMIAERPAFSLYLDVA